MNACCSSRILWMVPIYSLDSVSNKSIQSPNYRRNPEKCQNNVLKMLFVCLAVDRSKIPQDRDLRGHVSRMLRGVRHLQLPDVPAELPGESVSQSGAGAGGAGGETAAATLLLLPAVGHGRVSAHTHTHTKEMK